MKKKKLTSVSLKFTKTNVANLNSINGGKLILSEESACCTKYPLCLHTLTTRPDSLKANNAADDI
ncbi:hypothetical protein [uncultured Kordia sp.]|uniref:hypothetical protein n=1 Tax=uncultured Kordia sp. TaxID=507699 RepID=UPI002607B507|nr:hypothetical protein [uncultured Kordia sp.]